MKQIKFMKQVSVLVILGLFIITGCTNSNDKTNSNENNIVSIGAIFMLTGIGSNWGENSLQGADLAIAEINTNNYLNGKNLSITYEDNQGDNPSQAVTALQKLTTQDISIVLGPNWSPSGLAVAPIACEQGILMISPSLGIADFNEHCDYLFNVWPHDAVLSEQLGKHLYDTGKRKIGILSSNQVWEKTQADAVKKSFEQSGGTVVSFQLTSADQKDFKTEILKLKQTKPDAVVIQYSYEDTIARQIKELGLNIPIFAPLIDEDRIKSAQGALEGATAFTSFTPTAEFVEKFEKTHNKQPDVGSAQAYDSVMIIAQAIKETKSTDPEVLKNYLGNLKQWNGASGQLLFDGKRGVTNTPKRMIVTNDKLVDAENLN